MDLQLNDKRVLVTGGSKGIGLAVAQGFAAEGCSLVLVARDRDALQSAREAIQMRHSVPVTVESLDLAEHGSAALLRSKHPDIDIVVNNAGAIPGGSVDAVNESMWRTAWDLKVFGFINLCREYFAPMQARRSGVIVNVIGLAGDRPRFDYIAGASGNASLMAFTRALGGHSVDHDVRVVGVNPGYTETQRLEKSLRNQARTRFNDPERWRELLAHLPFGRAASAQEVADVVVFLASSRASYVSGTIVNVDGGAANRG